jgi:hypothetical protein
MANRIVNTTITQQVASAPSALQQTGAIISQGGTNTTAGTATLITQVSDLTSILSGSEAITSATWASSVVTVTTTTPHGIPSGDVVQGKIAGVTPSGYNGTFAITSTGTTTFTYPLVTNPGTMTVAGTFTLQDIAELTAQVNTWFAQGWNNAVYVLELGVGTPAQGVTALQSYINTTTFPFYAYLIPSQWDTESTAPTMMNLFASPTSKVYFYVTTTVSTYESWVTIKSVVATVQSPLAPVTEFSAAAIFWDALNTNPSSSNLMSQLEYQFVYGVTAYNTLTDAQIAALTAAGVNWIGTGAQGNISNTLIETGDYMDLNTFSYWFAIDWANIQCTIALAAAIIKGSQPQMNPLDYNQAGINTLQKTAQKEFNTGIAFGLFLPGAIVTATPFATYVDQNPSNYEAGIYDGFSATFTPQRGFDKITINLTAVKIPT